MSFNLALILSESARRAPDRPVAVSAEPMEHAGAVSP